MATDNPLLITNTDISGVLKNLYESFRVNAFPVATVLLAQLKKGKRGGAERMEWGGNGVFWDVVLNAPVGMHFSDAGYFPPGAQAIERQAFMGVKRSYVSRQIDALAIQGTAAKEAAYIPLVRKIVQEALDAAAMGQQRSLHGDGRGVLGVIGTVNSTTDIIVSAPYGLASSGRGGLLLFPGMYIAVRDTTGATLRGKAYISTVTNSGDNANLILATAIAGMVATDIIVTASESDDAYNREVNGLINVTNRGGSFNSLHNIDGATFTRWNTIRHVAGTDTPDATQPSEFDIWDLGTKVANVSGKNFQSSASEFLLLTTPNLKRKFAESFFGQRRWSMEDMVELKGGFKAVSMNGLPIVDDFYCPAGTVYLLHVPSLTWVDRQDFQKLSYEGAGPWRFVPGRDAYEVNFGAYWNFGALQRNAHGLITAYTDTARMDHTQ